MRIIEKLRLLKRINQLEYQMLLMTRVTERQQDLLKAANLRVMALQREFDSRRPCKHCGKHRYDGVIHTTECGL